MVQTPLWRFVIITNIVTVIFIIITTIIIIVIIGLDTSDAPLALRVAQMLRHTREIFLPCS